MASVLGTDKQIAVVKPRHVFWMCLTFVVIMSACSSSPEWHSVKYMVLAGGHQNCIARLTYRNASGGTEHEELVLPWEFEFRAQTGTFLYVSAQKENEDGTTIYSRIEVDGALIQDTEVSTKYGIATASGRVP